MIDRFQVTGPFDNNMPYYYIIIADYRWWVAHEQEIHQWMTLSLPLGIRHHQGMVVTLEHERDVSNFLLRWA